MKALKERLRNHAKTAGDGIFRSACQEVVAFLPHATRFGEWAEAMADVRSKWTWYVDQIETELRP